MMRKIIDEKLIKFMAVGIINTLVGMAIMFGLYNLAGCSYWLSSGTNYILTSIMSYMLNKHFTFGHKGDFTGSAVRFAINIVVCYLLAYGIAKPTVVYILRNRSDAIRDNAAMGLGMILFTSLNYLGQRFYTFRNGNE